MQLIDTRLQPGGVGANTGQAVTTGDPCTGHAPQTAASWRRAIVGISSCNVCTLHPKRRCLITLHYNLAESLSHQDHHHYHTNTYFHHFPFDNYGVLDLYKSWVDTCERWAGCYRQWVELVERTKTFSIATLDQVMCAQAGAVAVHAL